LYLGDLILETARQEPSASIETQAGLQALCDSCRILSRLLAALGRDVDDLRTAMGNVRHGDMGRRGFGVTTGG
jgi:hypothetical protein